MRDCLGWPSWAIGSTARAAAQFLSQPKKQTKEGWGHGDNSKYDGIWCHIHGGNWVHWKAGDVAGCMGNRPITLEGGKVSW